MFPVTPAPAPREELAVMCVRKYRHDPYGARVLETLESFTSTPAPALTSAPAALTLPCWTPMPESKATASSPSSYSTCSLTSNGISTTTTSPSAPAALTSASASASNSNSISTSNSTSVHVAVVGFKYGAREFLVPFRVALGDAVVTEGDRGEDLGVVRHLTTFNAAPAHIHEQVLRVATPEDHQSHLARAQREAEALHTMRLLARQVKCAAFIQDTMYQLDSRKITVIIARDSRSYIDFRRLQRAAFDVFRCRVWCAYLDEIAIPPMSASTFSAPKIRPLATVDVNRTEGPQRFMYGRRSQCAVMLPPPRDVSAQA